MPLRGGHANKGVTPFLPSSCFTSSSRFSLRLFLPQSLSVSASLFRSRHSLLLKVFFLPVPPSFFLFLASCPSFRPSLPSFLSSLIFPFLSVSFLLCSSRALGLYRLIDGLSISFVSGVLSRSIETTSRKLFLVVSIQTTRQRSATVGTQVQFFDATPESGLAMPRATSKLHC
ncbi:hypothetical protein CSUI_003913 [Cystoisospora suis]|uniref:Transmembrane protein n=1 Tax=Cystoisospora suis TaxID=483139 RepID=A0A2C6L2H3_9APIC|nr:hypothetical protein CSUI_003913 [Cystoisospora suis]